MTAPKTLTVYISIGNSDDQLTQLEWAQFADSVDRAVSRAAHYEGVHVHGRWYSLPTEPWQNACWCLEFDRELIQAGHVDQFRNTLAALARDARQDSIAWAETTTVFFSPR
jgi:hypothetical protein